MVLCHVENLKISKVSEKLIPVLNDRLSKMVENNVGKGEIAHYEQPCPGGSVVSVSDS